MKEKFNHHKRLVIFGGSALLVILIAIIIGINLVNNTTDDVLSMSDTSSDTSSTNHTYKTISKSSDDTSHNSDSDKSDDNPDDEPSDTSDTKAPDQHADSTSHGQNSSHTPNNSTGTGNSNNNPSNNSSSNGNNSGNSSSATTCDAKLASGVNPSYLAGFQDYSYEEVVVNTSYQYGVRIEQVATRTYAIFSDAGKCLYSESTPSDRYDRSHYQATTAELKSEAEAVLANTLGDIQGGINTLNGYRAEVSRTALTYNYDLALAATIRAIEIFWSGNFAHVRPDGRSIATIYTDLGISYSTYGENIAFGYGTVPNAMIGWRNSEGHYNNMISPSFREVGLGYYRNYFVTLFR